MRTKVTPVPVLPASDIERARRFYEEKLDFKVRDRGPDGGLLLEVGDGVVYVYPTETIRGGNTALSLEVEDFDEMLREIKERGVTLEEYDLPNLKTKDGVAEWDGMRAAWFKDTEGNIISIDESMTVSKLKSMAA